jgi:hypothetical protein
MAVTLSCTSTPVAANEPLVLVQSPKGTLIESFANQIHPATLCSISSNASNVKFISRTEIGYAINNAPDAPSTGVTEISRMSLTDRRSVSVARFKGDAVDFAWSPDGSNLSYLVRTEVPSEAERLWLKVGAAAPRALTPLIPLYGREYISSDELMVRFSHDGRYLLMVDTVVNPRYFQVWSVPGAKVVWSPPEPSTGPLTMAVWSHLSDRIYYQSSGVRTWDAVTKVVKIVAGGLNWSSPSLSPDDRLIAYAAAGSDGKPHLEVRDLGSGSVRILAGVRGLPVLLSDNLMIEGHYLANVNGAPGPAYYVGRYYALNLLTNVEIALAGPPSDVWTR